MMNDNLINMPPFSPPSPEVEEAKTKISASTAEASSSRISSAKMTAHGTIMLGDQSPLKQSEKHHPVSWDLKLVQSLRNEYAVTNLITFIFSSPLYHFWINKNALYFIILLG